MSLSAILLAVVALGTMGRCSYASAVNTAIILGPAVEYVNITGTEATEMDVWQYFEGESAYPPNETLGDFYRVPVPEAGLVAVSIGVMPIFRDSRETLCYVYLGDQSCSCVTEENSVFPELGPIKVKFDCSEIDPGCKITDFMDPSLRNVHNFRFAVRQICSAPTASPTLSPTSSATFRGETSVALLGLFAATVLV